MTKTLNARLGHLLLLCGWLAMGTGLRFTQLAAKPPWADEFATLVFSLGHSFHAVPLDQVISPDTLLHPLQPTPEVNIGSVINHLMSESTHPPVYFVLSHLWLRLFPPEEGLVSLWAARALSAVLGAVAIPAIFGLCWLAFRSLLVAQLSAAMMAFSPYGIYLAQEARHYTLAIVLIIASVSCLAIAAQHIYQRTSLPIWVGVIWVIVNSLGMATHYFFSLVLCAEGLVVLVWRLHQVFKKSRPYRDWGRIYGVAAGTFIGGVVWLPAWQSIPDNNLTEWVREDFSWDNILEPIGRLVAWLTTMLVMLPVEARSQPVQVVSGVLMVGFLLWVVPILVRGVKRQMEYPTTRLAIQVCGGFVVGAIALIFGITYSLGRDLTTAARFQYIYFPGVIITIGAALASYWLTDIKLAPAKKRLFNVPFLYSACPNGKQVVTLILLVGFLGGLTVVFNYGYQKPDRPELVLPRMVEGGSFGAEGIPVLIATVHKTHEQTGEMMGLAREFNASPEFKTNPPQFLLAHKDEDDRVATQTLQTILIQMSRPLQLWVINFSAPVEVEEQKCVFDETTKYRVAGYRFRLYRCS